MKCLDCENVGWVCENHPDRPWDGPNGCTCGRSCNNPAEGETPRMPEGFRTVFDKDGWRH